MTDQTKAILLPISDDGDPFAVGDMVAYSTYSGDSLTSSGSGFLGCIVAISGETATVDRCDSNMQQTGQTEQVALRDLREYMLPGDTEASESTTTPTMLMGSTSLAAVIPPSAAQNTSAKALYTDIELPSTAIKSLGDGRVGGYLVVYGNAQTKDLTGEYFTAETDFALDLYDKRPALYHHGLDAKAATTMIGTIDKIEPDDIGLWAEAQLSKHNAYARKVADLVAKGALSWSSGSLAHLAKRNKDGQILTWPVIEGSFTPSPAEPRYTNIFHIAPTKAIAMAYKALNLPITSLALEQDDESDDAQESARPVHAPVKAVKAIRPVIKTEPEDEMSQEEIKLAVAEAVKAALSSAPDPTAELKQQIADLTAQLAAQKKAAESTPTKSLPAGQTGIPVNAPTMPRPTRISVGEEMKWSGLDSQQTAFVHMFVNETAKQIDAGLDIGHTNIGQAVLKMRDEFQKDPEKRIERRIAAKALAEWGEVSEIAESVPFWSVDDAMKGAYKANELDSSQQSNAVVDWVPQLWNSQIILRARIANPVQALITQVNMTSNPYNLPIESTDPTAYYMPEGTDVAMLVLANSANTLNLSKVASNKLVLTAKKIGSRLGFSTEVQEDALPFVVGQIGNQVLRVVVNAVDDTIVNGDVATGASVNVNLVDATPPSTTGSLPTYLTLDGIRKYCLVTNTAQKASAGGALTLQLIRQMRFGLNAQYSVNLGNVVLFVDAPTYRKMLNMPEFLTFQNVGDKPSALLGLLPGGIVGQIDSSAANSFNPSPVGIVDGVPVYLSGQIPLAQTADGKLSTTGGNNTASSAIMIDRTRWFIGYRRGYDLQTFDNIKIFSDTIQMMATVRFALTSFDTACAYDLYNIV